MKLRTENLILRFLRRAYSPRHPQRLHRRDERRGAEHADPDAVAGRGGHDGRVLGTARFDARPPESLDAHLAAFEVEIRRSPAAKGFVRSVRKPANVVVGRPTAASSSGRPRRMLLTREEHGVTRETSRRSSFSSCSRSGVHAGRGPHLRRASGCPARRCAGRARSGVTTVFTLRNHGYEDRRYFEHVDHVFTTSRYLSDVYRQRIGLRSTGIESPIDWAEVDAPEEMRRFVTFVNPSLAKGAMLFARIAETLGSQRPEIPILVVQSASSAGPLNAIPGVDFTQVPGRSWPLRRRRARPISSR